MALAAGARSRLASARATCVDRQAEADVGGLRVVPPMEPPTGFRMEFHLQVEEMVAERLRGLLLLPGWAAARLGECVSPRPARPRRPPGATGNRADLRLDRLPLTVGRTHAESHARPWRRRAPAGSGRGDARPCSVDHWMVPEPRMSMFSTDSMISSSCFRAMPMMRSSWVSIAWSKAVMAAPKRSRSTPFSI